MVNNINMKKLLFLSAAALCCASCSSDQEDVVSEKELVNVTFTADSEGASTDATRAYFGSVDGSTFKVTFESNSTYKENMDVFEDASHITKRVFKTKDVEDYQSANFSGTWYNDNEAWAAILPCNSGTVTKLGTTVDFQVSIPNEQTTVAVLNNTMVSADRAANIMIGAQDRKVSPTVFLSPICSYLYFYSHSNTVQITSTQSICGTTTITGTPYVWNKWEDGPVGGGVRGTTTCTGGNSIQATGVHVSRTTEGYDNTIYEYIVCIVPGKYPAGSITIKNKTNTKEQDLLPVHLYYLGSVD